MAYLSRSVYGINGEVGINNASISGQPVTGCGAPAGTFNIWTCDPYNTANGMLASTTGNIYGIYDMSGGEEEYVMANYNNVDGGANGLLTDLNAKYIDIYTAYNNTKYGDALYETSSSGSGTNGWYGDYTTMINSSYPWLRRGGSNSHSTTAGVFSFSNADGTGRDAFGDTTWRAVMAVSEGL